MNKNIFVFFTMLAMVRGGFCAVQLNGATDYQVCNNTVNFSPKNLTMSVRVYVTAYPAAYAGIIGNKFTAGSYVQGYIKSTGKLAFYVNNNISNNYDGTGNFTVPLNTWTLITFTIVDNSSMNGYVNGQLDATVAVSGSLGAPVGNFFVGVDSAQAGRFLSAIIDDARIYNRALPQQEIKNLALSRSRYLDTDSYIGYWPDDDGQVGAVASTVLDRSSNRNNATFIGSPKFIGGTLNYP